MIAQPGHVAGMDSLLIRLTVALAVGLLVGLERGWHSRDHEDGQRAAGFRTFALTGLLGGVAGALTQVSGPIALGAIFIAYTAVFGAFEWMEAQTHRELSATSVVAGMLTFCLGAYAVLGDLHLAIACAVAMTGMLALREPLHRWIARLRWEDIRAVLILLAMTFLLLPVLPNRMIDPWNSINPSEIWLLAIMIAAISFGGYVAIRLFGDRLGVTMAAIAGGLASSTATTLTFARLGEQQPGSDRLLAGGILLSSTVMLIRVGVVATLLNGALLGPMLFPLVSMGLALGIGATILLIGNPKNAHPQIVITNPLELGTALKLAAVIAMVILLSQVVHHWIGDAGVMAVAAASGIADVDAVTISMARLGGHQIDLATATHAIGTTVAVNTVSKAVMAASVGTRKIGLYVGVTSTIALLAGFIALFLI
nr:MgtC/SapB family protein [Aquisediminimonas sediminicola]